MTTFSYAGTPLTDFGNVTMANDYLDIAERRGNDMTIPFHDGKIHVKKHYDNASFAFGIAVLETTEAALEATLDTMRALFAPSTQQTLSMTMASGAVRTIQAEVDKRIQFKRMSFNNARVWVEFNATSPFWRSNTAIADNTTTINSSPKAMTVNNTGGVEEREATITIDGPFSSITITNSTNSCVLTYTGAIGAAETVTIGYTNGIAYATLSTGSANVMGGISHSGDVEASLMKFNVGNNTLAITSAGGDNSGTVKISFNPAFL